MPAEIPTIKIAAQPYGVRVVVGLGRHVESSEVSAEALDVAGSCESQSFKRGKLLVQWDSVKRSLPAQTGPGCSIPEHPNHPPVFSLWCGGGCFSNEES